MSGAGDQVVLFIPRLSPSLNQWQRMHFRARKKLKLTWGEEFMAAVNDQVPYRRRPGWLKPARGPRRVRITRISSGTLDTDNLLGGLKPVLDAMKEQRLIEDDRPGLLSLEALQSRASSGEGLLVKIEPTDKGR